MFTISKSRWRSINEFNDAWIERTAQMLSIIKGELDSIESISFIVSGPPNKLSACINQYCLNSTTYFYDLVPWDDTVGTFDLDTQKIHFLPRTQVALFAGVLEYVNVRDVIAQALNWFPFVAISYSPVSNTSPIDSVLLQDRINLGWKNHLTLDQLITSIADHGYVRVLKKIDMNDQVVMLLVSWTINAGLTTK
jgi:hypothetical protein